MIAAGHVHGTTDVPPAAWVAGALVTAALAGAATAVGGSLTVLALGGLLLGALVMWRPPLAAYLLLAATPLIVGIDRGTLLPLLRPNEALLLLVGGAVLARGILEIVLGRRPLRLNPNTLDLAMLAMAVTSSLVPLSWMVARGRQPALDDVLYALSLWKYYAVYLVVRTVIRSTDQVRTCLWLSLASATVVGLIAVAQVSNVPLVEAFLSRWYTQQDAQVSAIMTRGGSTIGSPISASDVMVFNLAIALSLLFRGDPRRRLLLAVTPLLLLGALASAQFSVVFGIVTATVVVGLLCGTLRRILRAGVPVAAVAGVALAPVIGARLAGFDSDYGYPQSWAVRLENLRDYIFPEITSSMNWLFGVRPSTRVPAREVWRDFVYIESGHAWLLWNGGIPLLVAFLAFCWIAIRTTVRVARRDRSPIGAAATAAAAALSAMFVLMLFDPHLTMRGSADLLFPLLALALTAWGRPQSAQPRGAPA